MAGTVLQDPNSGNTVQLITTRSFHEEKMQQKRSREARIQQNGGISNNFGNNNNGSRRQPMHRQQGRTPQPALETYYGNSGNTSGRAWQGNMQNMYGIYDKAYH